MTTTVHVAAASAGLLLGLLVLLSPKGTMRHRVTGAAYVVALVGVNGAGLLIHEEARFGIFHWLAVVSLVTVLTGLALIALGGGRPAMIATHAYFMAWSYAGLVAAGVGQLVTTTMDGSREVVLAAIAGVLVLAGVLIHWRMPGVVASTLGQQ